MTYKSVMLTIVLAVVSSLIFVLMMASGGVTTAPAMMVLFAAAVISSHVTLYFVTEHGNGPESWYGGHSMLYTGLLMLFILIVAMARI